MTPIGAVRFRDVVTVVGHVKTLRVVPWVDDAPVLECTVFDETGGITLVFLGRRHLGGVELGRRIEAQGRAVEARHRLAILNPVYELH